ncbi:unnamed protein product [Haemonchus placei]|uniref:ABC transporter domain-containing protein n=1 Tax=Haemonchus placei TaxID=6290 RepID=A0A0N4WKJ3_HAEPC|nr:unnamed protein product [Haemonchus placei]
MVYIVGIYGVSLPWYFFLTKRYWFPKSVESTEYNISADSSPPANDNFETEPKDLTVTVFISDSLKEGPYKLMGCGVLQLDNLTLRLYEDQITALLGHNGAGKTTTMSILCGLYSPSSGTASVYGKDIRREIQQVRDVLGVCPQHNVLFSHLTVSEQLQLFAALKGTPSNQIQHDVDNILQSVSLVEKANDLASTLSGSSCTTPRKLVLLITFYFVRSLNHLRRTCSGGMKRRLCIGIALVGGSRFVILDEPTAGVDVTSRREIWSLLQKNKKGGSFRTFWRK